MSPTSVHVYSPVWMAFIVAVLHLQGVAVGSVDDTFEVQTVLATEALDPVLSGFSVLATSGGQEQRRVHLLLATTSANGSTCHGQQCGSGVWLGETSMGVTDVSSLRDFQLIFGDASVSSEECTLSMTLTADAPFRSALECITLFVATIDQSDELASASQLSESTHFALITDGNRIRRYIFRYDSASGKHVFAHAAVVVGSLTCAVPTPESVPDHSAPVYLFYNQTSRFVPLAPIKGVVFSTAVQEILFTQPFAVCITGPASITTFVGTGHPPPTDPRTGSYVDPFLAPHQNYTHGGSNASTNVSQTDCVKRWMVQLAEPLALALWETVSPQPNRSLLFVADSKLSCVVQVDLAGGDVQVVVGKCATKRATDHVQPCLEDSGICSRASVTLRDPVAITATSPLEINVWPSLYIAEAHGVILKVDPDSNYVRVVAGHPENVGILPLISGITQMWFVDSMLFAATRRSLQKVVLKRHISVTYTLGGGINASASPALPFDPGASVTPSQVVEQTQHYMRRTKTLSPTLAITSQAPDVPEPPPPPPPRPAQCGQPIVEMQITDDSTQQNVAIPLDLDSSQMDKFFGVEVDTGVSLERAHVAPPIIEIRDVKVRHQNLRISLRIRDLEPGSSPQFRRVAPEFRQNVSGVQLDVFESANRHIGASYNLSSITQLFRLSLRGNGWIRTNKDTLTRVMESAANFRMTESIIVTLSVPASHFTCPHPPLPNVPAFNVMSIRDASFLVQSGFDGALARHTSLATSVTMFASLLASTVTGPVALTDVQGIALLSLQPSVCVDAGSRRFGDSLWAISPFLSPSVPPWAAVAGNVGLALGGALLHAVVVVAYWAIWGKNIPSTAKERKGRARMRKKGQGGSGAPESSVVVNPVLFEPPDMCRREAWNEGVQMSLSKKVSMSTTCFPSATYGAASLLVCGIIFGATRTLMAYNEGGPVFCAVVGYLAVLALGCLIVYSNYRHCEMCVAEPYRFIDNKYWVEQEADPSSPLEDATMAARGVDDLLRKLLLNTTARKILFQAILPRARWMPPMSRMMFAVLLVPYRSGMSRQGYILWSVWVQVIGPVCLGLGLSLEVESMQGCVSQYSVIAAGCFATGLATLVVRPYITLLLSIVNAAAVTLTGVVFIGMVVVAQHPDTFGREANPVLGFSVFMLTVIAIFRLLYAALLFFAMRLLMEPREEHLMVVLSPPTDSDTVGDSTEDDAQNCNINDGKKSEGGDDKAGDRTSSSTKTQRTRRVGRPDDYTVLGMRRTLQKTVYGDFFCSKEVALSDFQKPLLIPPTTVVMSHSDNCSSPDPPSIYRPHDNPLHPSFTLAHGGSTFERFKPRGPADCGSAAAALTDAGGRRDHSCSTSDSSSSSSRYASADKHGLTHRRIREEIRRQRLEHHADPAASVGQQDPHKLKASNRVGNGDCADGAHPSTPTMHRAGVVAAAAAPAAATATAAGAVDRSAEPYADVMSLHHFKQLSQTRAERRRASREQRCAAADARRVQKEAVRKLPLVAAESAFKVLINESKERSADFVADVVHPMEYRNFAAAMNCGEGRASPSREARGTRKQRPNHSDSSPSSRRLQGADTLYPLLEAISRTQRGSPSPPDTEMTQIQLPPPRPAPHSLPVHSHGKNQSDNSAMIQDASTDFNTWWNNNL